MSLTQRILSLAVFAAAVACSSSVFAHSDVLFGNVGGKVTLGTAEDIGDPNTEDLSLFPAGFNGAFESIMRVGAPAADYESDEPGFYSDPNALGSNAVAPGLDVFVSTTSFTVDGATADLFYWDGTDPVDFNPAPAGTTFEFEQDPNTGIGTTTSGVFDDHPEFLLDADPNAVPADGVYLISFQVEIDTLATSDSSLAVLLVDELITSSFFALEVEEAIEALEESGDPNDATVDFGGGVTKNFAFYEEAVEYVEDNLVVPEPTTCMIAFIASGLVAVSRNRTVLS